MTSTYRVSPTPFPVSSKQASGTIAGLSTSVSCTSFSDKILVMISQGGKLGHWVHVPLAPVAADPMNPGPFTNLNIESETSLLPRPELTATTVLGGTKCEDEVVGQTLATTIASALLIKRPTEDRLLVVGMGFVNSAPAERDAFEEVLGLCLQCL